MVNNDLQAMRSGVKAHALNGRACFGYGKFRGSGMHPNENSLASLQTAWDQLLDWGMERNYLWTLVYLLFWFFFNA
jgi:hypothetical protein